MSLELLPAIDVRQGGVVRLAQGDYDRETRYSADPLELARSYAESGARWLHLVDLDAARNGGFTLIPLLKRIRDETDLRVQTGGGIRTEADLSEMLEAGAQRVVIGSTAVREPDRVARWIDRYGAERITVALDTRLDESGIWRLPVHGWTTESGSTLAELTRFYRAAGLRHLLCTDIACDGMLSGPNLELYTELSSLAPELLIQASGGVRALDDLLAAERTGCSAVVLGRALLESRFSMAEALATTGAAV